MKRFENRPPDALRKIKVTKHFVKHADGSCLIECGETRVICTAMMEESVPPFLKGSGTGWVTAEYGMLPASCPQRIRRNNISGRMHEIQRLIGRSLRAVVSLDKLGEITMKVDCDVLQADGGTRTVSITGGFIALALACKKLQKGHLIPEWPLTDAVAAVSVGIVDGVPLLDLDYNEDSGAHMDMNVVMVGSGDFVEIQGTAEGKPFSKKQTDQLLKLAQGGIENLLAVQKKVLGA